MANNIDLPDLDDGTEKHTIRSHFQPGKILEAVKAESESNKLKATPEKKRLDVSKPNTFPLQEIPEPSGVKDSASNHSSAFTHAFSHLKTSKYYEDPYSAQQQSNTKNSEQAKPAEKCTYKTNSIVVNGRQRGNPLLKYIANVPWEYGEIEPDYVMGQTTCALYLSLQYHNLYPDYIHDRLKSLGRLYQLRILLVHVDVVDPHPILRELSQIAILTDCTLMLVWSSEEAGRYIETYKIFENKSAEMIMEKQENNRYSQLVDCLSSVKSINKTNASTLLSTFETLENVIKANKGELSLCPGMGQQKAKRLYDVFQQPFLKSSNNNDK